MTDPKTRRRLKRSQKRWEAAKLERAEAMRAALADGMTLRAIGEVVNLTFQRVHQIVTDRKDPE